MKVAVAGGGIAGLATGIACALRGFDVLVYEQAPQLEEIGAGLQISANGWKVLDALGVTDELSGSVFEPPTIDLRLGHSGRKIWSLPMGPVSRERWGAPYVHVHRADLVAALANRLQELAPGSLRTGMKIDAYVSEIDQVILESESGRIETSDILIGADGWKSSIRQHMQGNEAPQYTGNVAWRAVVPVTDLGANAPPANTTIWAGKGRHAVTTRLNGGALVNFVGMVERPEPSQEGWRITGERSKAQVDFADFCAPISSILETVETINRWALFTRKPLTRWSEGRVIVLGDAAHPMLPSMAQGAVQALEDAWVVASLLATVGPAEAGPAMYKHRLKRTARIQKESANNARMFHRAGPIGSPIYYGGMAAVTHMAPEVLLKRQEWVYAHDVVKDWPL
ncbi:MAG: FAD-dependent monooxygenase [Paracoccaceae bacterium]